MGHESTVRTEPLAQQVEGLRARLGRLEVALSAIVDPLVWVDADGRVQWYNAPFRRLTDRPDAAVQGVSLLDVLPLSADGRRLAPEAHPVRLALRGHPTTDICYELERTGGRVMLEIFGVRVQFKQELNAVFAIHDVTGRKAAEAKERELAAAAASSAESARKRAAELDTAYRELQSTQSMLVQAEKMAAIGQLASGVAHEVKNPLGIIMQGVNFLESTLAQDRGDDRQVLQIIKEAVLRSDKIVRDMLNFARQTPLEQVACDLNGVLRTALELVGKQFTLQNVRVIERLDAGLPRTPLDANQIQQVLLNVLINALQAMPQGGSLTLSTSVVTRQALPREPAQRLPGVPPHQRLLLCQVQDTGMGMSHDKLARTFEPFFTTKPAGQGTGLGLAISRSIIEKHRGAIWLESVERQGTTACIALPIANGEARA